MVQINQANTCNQSMIEENDSGEFMNRNQNHSEHVNVSNMIKHKAEIVQTKKLYEQGHGTRAIARLVRVDFSCIAKWLRRYKKTGNVNPEKAGWRWSRPGVKKSQVVGQS